MRGDGARRQVQQSFGLALVPVLHSAVRTRVPVLPCVKVRRVTLCAPRWGRQVQVSFGWSRARLRLAAQECQPGLPGNRPERYPLNFGAS